MFRDGIDQSNVDFIQFGKTLYRTRTIRLPGFGRKVIAGRSLQRELLTKDHTDYASDEARHIDEDIFFYVPDAKLHQSDAMLTDFVKREVA